jgi:hypothetical protein
MRIKFLLLSAVVALIAFASCKKTTTTTITHVDSITKIDSVPYPDTTTIHAISDSISTDMNGLPFVCDSAIYFIFNNTFYNNGTPQFNGSTLHNQLDFESFDPASRNNFTMLVGTLGNSFPAKTYGAFGDTTTYASIAFDSASSAYIYLNAPGTGTITITSITNSTLKGTFQGTLYLFGDTNNSITKKVITNGKFSIIY